MTSLFRTALCPTFTGGLLLASLAACQPMPPRSRAETAAIADCRSQVDRTYAAQNRVQLSERDQRDTPFAAGYLSGVTSQGLGADYARDSMFQSCLAQSAAPGKATPAVNGAPGTGPTFDPAVRR